MTRVRPGWLVALCAGVLAVSAWLPWLTTTADGGGRASAIGGTAGTLSLPSGFGVGQLIVLLCSTLLIAGAMTARGLSAQGAAVAALLNSLLLGALTVLYYYRHVGATVTAGYGFYIGIASVVGAVAFSVWSLIEARRTGAPRRAAA